MADTLINRLSALPGVVVAPFSSVRSYDRAQDPLAAGRTLRVGAVLESNIQVQSDRVRVTSRLLDVDTGVALWSGRFDERLSDFFAIQDSLAQQVADALEVQLTAASRQLVRRHETDDVEAWQLYLKGRFHWGTRSEAGFRQAIRFFEAALARDPEFALATAALADVWGAMGVFDMVPPGEAFGNARRAADRAIALDNDLAEAHATLGHVLVQNDRDWKGGEAKYRYALKLKPSYTQAVFWLGNNCCFQGRLDEALHYAQQARAMEPMSVVFAANVGLIQYCARRYGDARRTLTELVETMPQYALARRFLARVAVAEGNAQEALALLRGHEAEHAPGALSDLGRALALAGDSDAARGEIARLEDLGAKRFGVGMHLALVHAALGNTADALTALERGLHDGSQMLTFVRTEPGLDPLRNDDRFRRVAQALHLD
jgi:serine/threonine-protein kinase